MNPFNPACLVDDPLEEPSNRLRIEWSAIGSGDIGDDLGFALGRVDLQGETFLDMPDFDRALGAFVEELDENQIDLIDPLPPALHRGLIICLRWWCARVGHGRLRRG